MNILEYSPNPKVERALARISNPAKVRVLFVCLGNICRSPAAEGLMVEAVKENHSQGQWIIDSAGTGNYHIGDLPDPRMRAHARRRGLELTHRCRQVRESDFRDFDLIIGMDASNLRNLRNLAPTPEDEEKVLGMSEFFDSYTRYDHVPDPYYDGAEGFELVLDLLTAATRNLRDTVLAGTANSLA
ncbi:MAG: low molecular weight phosphotyrosine protein phosphatase [Firmicutes bacterium]|nr:low molecular weight phosphotyrosine protein phosphatase [Bacillota bacterium]MCM1401340.1 low molecular weight phosphotyrosine protein phosphatase [Bacteroides sp.]MCM1477293.1 low molecular weight phosphotyrosine protein phosphatase [Bacteroides sp.]